jgi:DNA end-binding protein Ku
MARALGSGSITFGLVNVPVKAYPAVRDHSVHQLDRTSGARVRYEKVSEASGKVYYDHTYWLAPDGQAAEQAYRLLEAAMERTGRAGIGTVVMRNKQYLAAIRPMDGALAMSTMRFVDEVVPKSSVEPVPSSGAKPGAEELQLATQIIDSLTTEWDPALYRDTFTDELEDLLQRKAKGEKIVVEEAAPERGKVLDLMSALEASIAAAKKAEGEPATGKAAEATHARATSASAARAPATRASGAHATRSAAKRSPEAPTVKRSQPTRAPAKRSARRKSA